MSTGEPAAAQGMIRRDSDLSTHSQSRRVISRTWSVASGASAGSEGSLSGLPPGVRPPSASRVRQRQGIAMRPSEEGIIVKSGPTVEEKAAVVITAAARGHAARKQVAALKQETAAARAAEEKRQNLAATKITSVAKGRVARQQVAVMKKQEAQLKREREAAAAAAAAMQQREAEARATAEAARAAIQEAEARQRIEMSLKADIARRTAEFEEESSSLRQAVRERDVQLGRLKGDIATQLAVITTRNDLIDELRTRIKELEVELAHAAEMKKLMQLDIDDGKTRETDLGKKIKALQKPPMKDVCLSPRPLDDTPFLSQRDAIIARQEEQIKMLTRQVANLMGGIDKVEDQVDIMQTQVVSRDVAISQKKEEADDLRAEVQRLNQVLKEVSAKEYAMDSATKQNTDLLKLLMKTETDVEELREALARSKEEVSEIQARHSVRIREAADATTRATVAEREARMLREELAHFHATIGVRMSEVSSQLDDTTKTAAVHVESMAEELRLRREKQYELLDKMRVMEEELDTQGRHRESMDAQTNALQQRNMELEVRLAQANKYRETHAASAAEAQAALQAEVNRLAESLRASNEEYAIVKSQLTQLSASVVQLAEKEQAVLGQLDKSRESIRAREGEIAVLNERVAQLVDDAIRAQRDRGEAEQRARVAVDALTALQKDHATLVARTKGMMEGDPARLAAGPQFVPRAGDTAPSWAATGTLGALPSAALQAASSSTAGQSATDQQLHRLVSAHRLVLRRFVGVHVGAATTTTAVDPPSHLRNPAPPDMSGGSSTSIPVASLLFGSDMYGHPATSTRAAVGSFSSAAVGRSLTFGGHADSGMDLDALRQVGILDLSGLDLNDDDVAVLVYTLSRLPLGIDSIWRGPSTNVAAPGSIDAPRPIVAIDLRGNQITDVGAALLARLVSGGLLPETGGAPHVCSRLKLLDLRGNKLSSLGLRLLAEALRENVALGVQHVYVGAEGMVRALGPKPRVHNDYDRSAGSSDALGIVAILDIRLNKGESAGDASAAATTLLGAIDAVVTKHEPAKAGPAYADLSTYRTDSIDFSAARSVSGPPPAPSRAAAVAPAPTLLGYSTFGSPAVAPPPLGPPASVDPRSLRPVASPPAWAVPAAAAAPIRRPSEADLKASQADHLAAMAAADEVLGVLNTGAYEPEFARTGGSKALSKSTRTDVDRARLKSAERRLIESSPYAPKRTDSLPHIPR